MSAPARLAGAVLPQRTVSAGAGPIVVADADWRGDGAESAFARLRGEPAIRHALLLASGPGAQRLSGADGVVLEAEAIEQTGPASSGLRGAWAGTAEELRIASNRGCDFVLVRSAALAEKLRARAAPLPAYFPPDGESMGAAGPARWPWQGQWIDLRSPAADSR